MTQEIEVIIDQDDDTSTEIHTVSGFVGGSCVRTLAQVQAGLGLGKPIDEGDTADKYRHEDVNAFVNSLK